MVGMLCLNVDGAYVSSLQHGGIGDVLRNVKGEFITGFAYRVPNVSSAYHIELFAIKSGLEIIQALGLSNIALMSDCLEAVKAVTEEDQDLSSLGTIVEDIKGLLGELQSIGVHHTYRTANHVAHRLAGLGFDSDIHMEWFFQAPESVLDALQYDCNRMNH
ncbi:putative ribonuclease H-like domain-containing protein [Rosa chinensis]|uniref:Putative ribonuclease H-like domain-containing protein n=1 Tax=Rosa chinensis TaxID=74649 RepID=A0A2P6RXY9_ROSCH|nr:putative ribonuclease H-like domain-containing protein [Rosa chinensis]